MDKVYHKGVFVKPHILPIAGEIKTMIRILHGNFDASKRHSGIGYEGDIIYLLEAGKMVVDSNTKIFYRPDGTAVNLSMNKSQEIEPTYEYEQIPQDSLVPPASMPRWAARYWYKIVKVSFPRRINTITQEEIEGLGIKRLGEFRYRWGGLEAVTPVDSYRKAFEQLWDFEYGAWSRKFSGDSLVMTSFPFAQPMTRPNSILMDQMNAKFTETINPYVTLITIERLHENI